MRRFGLLAAGLALATGSLAAQHAGQVEVGAFGSYTRYDATFGLARKIGGGVRLGYLLGNIVGVEADVLFQPEYTVSASGTPTTLEPLIGSLSLVINAVHVSRLMAYVLGGYSLLDFGTRAPYHFTDNGAHGGVGVRLFLTERVALRVEGRAIYSPSTQSTFGPKATASPTASISAPAPPRASPWTRQAAHWTRTRTASPTGSINAPTPRRGPPSTRAAARWILTSTACPTGSTSVPTHRRAPR